MRISDWSSDVCSSDLEEAGKTDRIMAPVKAPPRRGLDDGELLRYGADLKSSAPATAGRGSRFMEWIGNRHEVSLKVAGVADGRGNVKRPGSGGAAGDGET